MLSITTIRRVATFGIAATIGLSVMTGVASAAPAANDGNGPDPTTAVTEDNDTNDNQVNNIVDGGDNAHPSGNDRSVEHGGSGNQGDAAHDPDDDGRGPDRTNGGPDQPGGAGGVDPADQDGNNGCGNDDDFEDDNEGWCGKPTEQEPTVPPAPPAEVIIDVVETEVVETVITDVVITDVVITDVTVTDVVEVPTLPVAPVVAAAADVVELTPSVPERSVATEVLGLRIEPTVRAAEVRPTEVLGVTHERGSLARTGADLTSLALLAVALVAVGLGCQRAARRA